MWEPCLDCRALGSNRGYSHPALRFREFPSNKYSDQARSEDLGHNFVCSRCERAWDFTRTYWADPLY